MAYQNSVKDKRKCPVCGCMVQPAEMNINVLSKETQPKMSARWICNGCGMQFAAETDGVNLRRKVSADIDIPGIRVAGEVGSYSRAGR